MPLHNLFWFSSLLCLLKFHNLDPQSFSLLLFLFAPYPTWKGGEQAAVGVLSCCLGSAYHNTFLSRHLNTPSLKKSYQHGQRRLGYSLILHYSSSFTSQNLYFPPLDMLFFIKSP